jgi:hypothetical protein
VSASFDGEFQSGDPAQFSANIPSGGYVYMCDADQSITLAGGVFDGVKVLLSNVSDPLTAKQSYIITGCETNSPDGGAFSQCSGTIEKINP